MKNKLENKTTRCAIRLVVVSVLTLLINYYFSFSHDYLIPITAIATLSTAIGNVLYQSIKRFIIILLIVSVLSWLFSTPHLLNLRIFDVCIGAMIGILSNLLILPIKPDKAFRHAIAPIFNSYADYLTAIADLLLQKNFQETEANKIIVETQLQHLPTWVYEPGFDKGLQKGHRFFLAKTQQIAEILFAMHHIARHSFDTSLLESVQELFSDCIELARKFFIALATVFELKKLEQPVDDFSFQLIELEKAFQAIMPLNLEALELSNDGIYFYEFIYTLKDLRRILFLLAQALR